MRIDSENKIFGLNYSLQENSYKEKHVFPCLGFRKLSILKSNHQPINWHVETGTFFLEALAQWIKQRYSLLGKK